MSPLAETPDSITLALPPEPSSPAEARHAVKQLAARAGAPPEAVALAVSEAVTNAIVHAAPGADEPISVQATVTLAPELEVVVEDHAGGMRPIVGGPGLGIGLAIIISACDRIQIEQRERGTRMVMWFACS